MHRLLVVRSIVPSSLHPLTLPRYPRITPNCYTTSHTEFSPGFYWGQQRPHATTPNLDALRLIKKKRKTRKKKFTELLQVTESATTETKTSVKKLKSKKLSEFIGKSSIAAAALASSPSLTYSKLNFTLETPENRNEDIPMVFVSDKLGVKKINQLPPEVLNEIIESYQCFREMTEVEAIVPPIEAFPEEMEPLEEEAMEHIETILAPTEAKISAKKEKMKKKDNYKSRLHVNSEQEQLAKQKCLFTNMSAYLELCISSGMLNRGLSTFLNYRNRWKKCNIMNHYDIRLYNILLQGYAESGNLGKVKEIIQIIKADEVTMIPQTFALVIECIGRQEPNLENTRLLQKYLKEASDQEISLNDIMDKSKFVSDQREIVLDTIHRLEPGFTPSYTPPELTYSNNLLNSLNENIQEIERKPKVPEERMNEAKELLKEQMKIEMKGYLTVKSIEKFAEPTPLVLHYRTKLSELQKIWRTQIIAAFNRDLNTIRAQTQCKFNKSINLFPYLKVLDTGQYADILLREIRTLAEGSETYSPTVGQLYRELGAKVQMRYYLERMKNIGLLQKTSDIYLDYLMAQKSEQEGSDNHRQLWQKLVFSACNEGPNMDYLNQPWSTNITSAIGKFLYNILMRDVKIDLNVMKLNGKGQNLSPAFFTLYRSQGRHMKEEVKPHPVLSKLFRGSQQETLTFDTNLVPMVCPPQPWSTPNQGGYLVTKSDLIRLPHQAHQQWSRINESSPKDIYPALDSLNQLASVPWSVNGAVLDVVLEVFNNGGSEKLDVPQPPSVLLPPVTLPDDKDMTNEKKYHIYHRKMAHKRRQAEMYSLWCDCLYRLSLANHFRDRAFWLPHNMDFRGRVYPLPPHLSHMGSDLARSLLMFHEGKPLGPDGLNWLKIHCINLTGTKKRDSVAVRLAYANEIIEDILDSADNPLSGRMWWAKSDEPWQTLASCMEIANVMRSADPEAYVSHFPIHQDGSCNGLQHYAALGRDRAGAVSVNLASSETPQDVYSSVAALVEEARAKDAANGLEIARVLDGFIRRKVIKQTVMTTVYGVTRYGARLQIARQLKDIEEFPKDLVWQASSYLTVKTFESLREMFKSTREIQDWFTHCARLISAVCFQNVEWVTPLGLPVVQPYNRMERTISQKGNKVGENFPIDMYEKPNTMKQKNAFPPNFIHSLDSSHMMLTSLYCQRAGLTFISVHDCFWTHACTVPTMNVITREQFVALHSLPILEDLSEFLKQKYCFKETELKNDGSVNDATKRKLNRVLKLLPGKGDFNLENVLKSVYFFS
ncbi:DNA-directed RNA polymerase, mitochondrial [Phlebotomus argentipes]|uniref:DNA-directed RNA polymerase, mitochondrial n=1 Tax=Phlebotomus argentipes TaxID=94469 RepID=UPI0028935E77|nr:DNA-directed RNA polymerase, mitochondrial [Phlebotomus argentipes]